jgi:hypothetical protein
MKALTNLKVLDLGGTATTDGGLAQVGGLTNLAQLLISQKAGRRESTGTLVRPKMDEVDWRGPT